MQLAEFAEIAGVAAAIVIPFGGLTAAITRWGFSESQKRIDDNLGFLRGGIAEVKQSVDQLNQKVDKIIYDMIPK